MPRWQASGEPAAAAHSGSAVGLLVLHGTLSNQVAVHGNQAVAVVWSEVRIGLDRVHHPGRRTRLAGGWQLADKSCVLKLVAQPLDLRDQRVDEFVDLAGEPPGIVLWVIPLGDAVDPPSTPSLSGLWVSVVGEAGSPVPVVSLPAEDGGVGGPAARRPEGRRRRTSAPSVGICLVGKLPEASRRPAAVIAVEAGS